MGKITLIIIISIFCSCAAYAQDIKLNIINYDGGTTIDFGSVKSMGLRGEEIPTYSEKYIEISVKNTTSKKYQVIHRLSSSMRNQTGFELNPGSVMFRATGGTSGGILGAKSNTILGTTEKILFTSNANGDDDMIQVCYILNIPPGQEAGDYLSSLVFIVRTIE